MIERELMIINKLGLHARAAAKLVNTAAGFSSEIQLRKDSKQINAKSIMGVMMLAASCGSQVVLSIEGEDEESAMQALVALIQDRFGEGE